jgi:hypothetical protein
METTQCPNCDEKIKNGTFSSNALLSRKQVELINHYFEDKKDGYCGKCGASLVIDA